MFHDPLSNITTFPFGSIRAVCWAQDRAVARDGNVKSLSRPPSFQTTSPVVEPVVGARGDPEDRAEVPEGGQEVAVGQHLERVDVGVVGVAGPDRLRRRTARWSR